MIDTHCHVHDRAFDADREEVVRRAGVAGVRAMLTVAEDLDDAERAIATADRYDLAVAAGIHPHEAKGAPADLEVPLRLLLRNPRVVAVGEIGLDYYYDRSPRELQVRVLRAQLRVARAAEMPVVFHQRDAFTDFTAILRDEWDAAIRGVVHCFTGTPEQALAYTREFGLFLGIGGVLTFATASGLREAVRAVGVDRIVLETDCPYLAPVPMRGKRNEPAFVTHTAAKLAEVLELPLDRVVKSTDANAGTLFGLGR